MVNSCTFVLFNKEANEPCNIFKIKEIIYEYICNLTKLKSCENMNNKIVQLNKIHDKEFRIIFGLIIYCFIIYGIYFGIKFISKRYRRRFYTYIV